MNEKAPRSSHGAFLEANSARGRPWGGSNYAELWDPNPRGGFRFLTNRSYAQGFEVSELIGEPVPRSERVQPNPLSPTFGVAPLPQPQCKNLGPVTMSAFGSIAVTASRPRCRTSCSRPKTSSMRATPAPIVTSAMRSPG